MGLSIFVGNPISDIITKCFKSVFSNNDCILKFNKPNTIVLKVGFY